MKKAILPFTLFLSSVLFAITDITEADKSLVKGAALVTITQTLNGDTLFVPAYNNCNINGTVTRTPLALAYTVQAQGPNPTLSSCNLQVRRLRSHCDLELGGSQNEQSQSLLPSGSTSSSVSATLDLWASMPGFLTPGQYRVRISATSGGVTDNSPWICFAVVADGDYNVDFVFTDLCAWPATALSPSQYSTFDAPYIMDAFSGIVLDGRNNTGYIERYALTIDEMNRINGSVLRNIIDGRTLPQGSPLTVLPDNSFNARLVLYPTTYYRVIKRAQGEIIPGNYNVFLDPANIDRTYRLRFYGYNACTSNNGVFKEVFIFPDSRGPCTTVGIGNSTANFTLLVKPLPNPSTLNFELSLSKEITTEADLIVTDIQGRTVHTVKLPAFTSQYTIPASDWPAGMYIYRLVAGENQLSGKLIKE